MYKLIFLLSFLFCFVQTAFGQCNTELHSNVTNDAWLSCETSPNPNTVRGIGHWIQYDFGFVYQFNESHFWNSNEAGLTERGFKEVAIDYSMDGTNWTELGQFEFEEASGESDYPGFEGPNFGGIEARYVLLTMISTFNDSDCTGLAEVQFFVDETEQPTTSIESIELENTTEAFALQLFPIPTKAVLNIQTEQTNLAQYKISNELGQIVQEGKYQPTINVKDFANGIYYLSIKDKNENWVTRKFVKVGS